MHMLSLKRPSLAMGSAPGLYGLGKKRGERLMASTSFSCLTEAQKSACTMKVGDDGFDNPSCQNYSLKIKIDSAYLLWNIFITIMKLSCKKQKEAQVMKHQISKQTFKKEPH